MGDEKYVAVLVHENTKISDVYILKVKGEFSEALVSCRTLVGKEKKQGCIVVDSIKPARKPGQGLRRFIRRKTP